MLKFTNLSLRRGPRELLQDVELTIHHGQKVGITGSNGVGKSSLFALILGHLHADSGDVFLPKNLTIAHVAQETPALDSTAIEYVLDGDVQLRQLEKDINAAEENNQGEVLAHLYSEMEAIDGYSANSRAATLLNGLGFTTEQEHSAVKQFSGGWRMRLNLAQALMCRSDILLLDEPTNHLDLDAVIWLEAWLKSYKGTLLLISHDRDFLDNVADNIAHIENQGITLYSGNYSAFEVRRAEYLASQQSAYEKQQREVQHMHKFVERFKAKASKAKQAQSRVKALERMELIAPAHVDSPFNFTFKKADKMPNPLITLDDVAIGYTEEPLLSKVKFTIHPGDRIGLLGHNGAGKSTLIKLLSGELKILKGKLTAAKELNIGYFAQHQLEQLDFSASPLLHLQRLDPKATESDLRKYLGGFAFNNDMAIDPVAPLSGGEKARLVLALVVYQRPNLLLLDEPTNHLDLEMRHALTVAMQDFEGAMIIVSHDRHLLRTVTDNFLLVANGKVAEFDGSLDDYRNWLSQENKKVLIAETEVKENNTADPQNKKQQRQISAEKRRLLKPLQNRLKKLEKQMEELSSNKESLQEKLADNDIYNQENKELLKTLLEEQGQVDSSLQQVEMDWLEVSEELESAST
ncbi:MAG: ATP-binding cassette domain-containing protein [Gammaproteobacteria bacterium]|nr:ATP-binding cassette domain-containing protein [Gammaproteobacteria bacterium]MCW8986408.1 ATP-binding cassette domain-containing protein [Gammaproteobacteria bacterium]